MRKLIWLNTIDDVYVWLFIHTASSVDFHKAYFLKLTL